MENSVLILVEDLNDYAQTKKTMNTENIPGMCVLTNHMRDLVTAENEWVLSHRMELVLELFWKSSRFKFDLYPTEIESAFPLYLRKRKQFWAVLENKISRQKQLKWQLFHLAVKIPMFSLHIGPLIAQLTRFISAESIHAFEVGLQHTTSSCKFWKWHSFKFSNGTPGYVVEE